MVVGLVVVVGERKATDADGGHTVMTDECRPLNRTMYVPPVRFTRGLSALECR